MSRISRRSTRIGFQGSRNSLEHLWRLGFGLLLALLLLNAVIALFNTRRLVRNTSRVSHTYRVLRTLNSAFSSMQDAETGVRGYVISGRESFLEPYYKGVKQVGPDLDDLKSLTSDNPPRAQQIADLERLVRIELTTLRNAIALFQSDSFEAVQRTTRTERGKQQMDSIRRVVAAIEEDENKLLTRRDRESSQSAINAVWTFWIATLANLALLTGVYFLLMRDMAEHKRIERSLREASEAAETANRAKSEFISGVSHELRTPLNAVIGFSKLLLNPRVGPLNEDQAVYTQDIVQSAEHLLQLINDILDISKIEAGKMTLDLAPFDLAELLHSSLGIVRQKAQQENLTLSTDLAPEITEMAMIVADRRKIKQVLYNLLSNAVKFTPQGGSVTVSARPARGDEWTPTLVPKESATVRKAIPENGVAISKTGHKGATSRSKTPRKSLDSTAIGASTHNALPDTKSQAVVVSIRDTGIGIPLDHQSRVFGAFEQVDSSYARQQAGTGLGLALTKRMVELHGGTLWLESEEGVGSTFSFSLPLRASESAEDVAHDEPIALTNGAAIKTATAAV